MDYGYIVDLGAIAQSETDCIAYKLTGFVVVARFIHITCFLMFFCAAFYA